MRRIVNILAKMVSAIVLALIFLPLLVALLFEIPAVQNFVAREATEIISRKLGTRISIDRVDIGLFYRVSLDGFYVDDFQRDTLLYAGRLDARIKSLGLFGEGSFFSRAELSDARFCLRETPDGEMNIKQVVDKLSKRTRPGRRENSGWRSSVWKRMGWISAWNGWSTAIRRTGWISPICT